MPIKEAFILVNLGTPTAPTAREVRRFLKNFLSDPRVVNIPRVVWLPLLYGIILPFRSSKVAKLYEKIWWPEGSPLKIITQRQTRKLAAALPDKKVSYAMAYGEPSLQQQIERLIAEGVQQIKVLPLYPQYCSATTGSVIDQIAALPKSFREKTEISLIESYHNHEKYLSALETSIRAFWQANGKSEKLLISFHGIPQRLADSGDLYYTQCLETAAAVVGRLQLTSDEWAVCFQSRFGKAEWVKPYTDVVITDLALWGVKSLDVITPAFASDCLETLEEISVQNEELFKSKGGNYLRLIPCLNDSDEHIDMMMSLFAS